MQKIDFIDFYKKFLIFSDQVAPQIPPVEQPVLFCIFSHTVGMGKSICQLSYNDLHELTGLSLPTIKKALRSLMNKGFIKLVNMSSARVAKTYEFVWSMGMRQYSKLQRDPIAVIRDMYIGEKHTSSLIDKLTSEDRDMLMMLISNLSREEEAEYREIAASIAKEYDDQEKLFQEIVASEKFGKLRLMKYSENSEEDSAHG